MRSADWTGTLTPFPLLGGVLPFSWRGMRCPWMWNPLTSTGRPQSLMPTLTHGRLSCLILTAPLDLCMVSRVYASSNPHCQFVWWMASFLHTAVHIASCFSGWASFSPPAIHIATFVVLYCHFGSMRVQNGNSDNFSSFESVLTSGDVGECRGNVGGCWGMSGNVGECVTCIDDGDSNVTQ